MMEERFFSVPLNLEIQSGLIAASPYPRMVRVTLRGDANSIYPIIEDDIEVYADLLAFEKPGVYNVPIKIRREGTAQGMAGLEINAEPLELTVELDQRVSKYVPLTPAFQGYPEDGYELINYTLTPAQVAVDGPVKLMNSLHELSTVQIDLSGRNEDFMVPVRILSRDPLLVVQGDGLTEFQGYIQQALLVRTFSSVQIEVRGLPAQFEADALPVAGSLRVEGAQTELQNWTPPAGTLTVDASAVTMPGTYTLAVQLSLPEGMTASRREPQRITLTVRERPEPAENSTEGVTP
jgi:YbbR domain-containing protein